MIVELTVPTLDGGTTKVNVLHEKGRLCVHRAVSYGQGAYTISEIQTSRGVIIGILSNFSSFTEICQACDALAPFFEDMPDPVKDNTGFQGWLTRTMPEIWRQKTALGMER